MSATAALAIESPRLWAYGLFMAVLAGAGLPIYIYAPKFFADSYGVSLTALSAVLFGLRLFDVVQDPALGWLAERLRRGRALAVAGAGAVMALSMLALFAVTPPIAPLWWFGITLVGLFSTYSFLTIVFYAQGVAKAEGMGQAHERLAAWRESGGLLGVCLASVAPTVLAGLVAGPYAAFAVGFAAAVLLAVLAMAPEWRAVAQPEATPLSAILGDRTARRLLILALVNSAPLAVSSTLFLFYVESRLAAPGWEGPLLLVFFLAAALSAPGWSLLARRFSPRHILLSAMAVAIASFGVVPFLGAGDQMWFLVVCLVSGASIGADLTLLPALFARRMAVISPNAAQGFGLWSFVTKVTLAFAAVALLPLLESQGFQSGAESPAAALTLLALLYGLVPVFLKLLAALLLVTTPMDES